jgi:hypothetical protein
MTWIACSERMPEPLTEVLFWLPHGKRLGLGYFCPSVSYLRSRWEDRAQSDEDGDPTTYSEDYVTHWMPLPEAP